MAASRNDSNVLGTYTPFVNRVESSLLAACVSIASEGTAVASHFARIQLVHQILANPTTITNFSAMFALTVATDATVLSDATAAGTVVLTTNNISTQQALVTDAHIDAAVSGQFNSFCQNIPA